ncbi:MAG TPA: NAD-dependent deacylase [Pirellulaceae bacterium]|jgi:NAD-dependent deacetylase|nr:NAD-dependent deacylase [Pirellulaceae bacterium]
MLAEIAHWLQASSSTVAFSGAGISTESGIPDFRSPGGIWATSQPVYFDDFLASADARREYWRQKSIAHRDFADAQPNLGHRVLARWEQSGRLETIITQNIDGLHQIAGSRSVCELHGTARSVVCLDCAERFPDVESLVNEFLATDQPPSCPDCGGIMKHATVSFGQSLPTDVLDTATQASQRADLFLAMGSSLVVQPAASLPAMAKEQGARLVIINRDPTPLDDQADAVIHASIGETLEKIDQLIS